MLSFDFLHARRVKGERIICFPVVECVCVCVLSIRASLCHVAWGVLFVVGLTACHIIAVLWVKGILNGGRKRDTNTVHITYSSDILNTV